MATVLLAYPVWFALNGPASFPGDVWVPNVLVSYSGNSFGAYLRPTPASSAAYELSHQYGGYQGPALSAQFMGLGMVVVVIAGWIIWRRDKRLWVFGVIGLLSIALSLGLHDHEWTPWRLFVRFPLMENIEPYRFVLITYLVVGIMLGLIVDHTYVAAKQRRKLNDRSSGVSPEGLRQRLPRWSAETASPRVWQRLR